MILILFALAGFMLLGIVIPLMALHRVYVNSFFQDALQAARALIGRG